MKNPMGRARSRRMSLAGMAIAVAYSIWCGIGISLIAVISAVAFDGRPTLAQAAGIALVAIGVVLVQSGAHTA